MTTMHTDAPAPAASPLTSRQRERVRHAIFPVAGFGAAFLPATKACPKEMLPIVDRPLIQYAVEEAVAAGLTRMIFVTGRGKRAIEDHFDRAYELERELLARGDDDGLQALCTTMPPGVSFSYVRQREATGIVDALAKVRCLVGDEPFAVVVPDQLIDAEPPALAQLMEVFDEQHVSVIGAERSMSDHADAARLISADLRTSSVRGARALVKVPPIGAQSAPLGLCGRFVFTPAVWTAMADTARGALDATLTDVVRALMERERVFARLVDGHRFDCGTRLGFLQAQLAFARKRAELWGELRESVGELFARSATGREGEDSALTSAHTPPPRPLPGASQVSER